jgi:hypothetical protein
VNLHKAEVYYESGSLSMILRCNFCGWLMAFMPRASLGLLNEQWDGHLSRSKVKEERNESQLWREG